MSQKRKKPQQPDQNASDSPIENEVIDLSINQSISYVVIRNIHTGKVKQMDADEFRRMKSEGFYSGWVLDKNPWQIDLHY